MVPRNISRLLSILALSVSFGQYGCKDTVVLPDQPVNSYTHVYMPEAVNGPVTVNLVISDSVQTAVYGANYGGLNYPTSDIPVTFSVNNSLIDSFNTANGTNYAPLPDGSFTLSNTNSVIPGSQLTTPPLTISFKTKGTDSIPALKTFLLPITLGSGSKIPIQAGISTTFYVVRAQPNLADYPFYDRSHWKILAFDSQEAIGEGPNNGRAVFCLDGDSLTYWHTQWDGASPGPPHWLVIDMGAPTILHGLSFLDRQSNNDGKPNQVNISVSADSLTWTDAGTFNLQNVTSRQTMFMPNGFQSARYFKYTVISAYNATYTHLAELNAF